jgi:flavin reductase (DIM6/NTAB) family NADH-FMN oxidoreductase RutF
LEENGEFVVNVPEFSLGEQSTFCGRKSGKEFDKFKECKLAVEKSKKVAPPIIAECAAAIECKVYKTIELGDHVLVVGEVLGASADAKKFEGFFKPGFRPLLHVKGNNFTTSSGEEKTF